MGILKRESCNYKNVILVIAIFGLYPGCFCPADLKAEDQQFEDSSSIDRSESKEDIVSEIARLRKLISDNYKGDDSFRIRYRMGVLYFKAEMNESAEKQFLSISKIPDCPKDIRIYCLNMLGQISRIDNRSDESMGYFQDVIETVRAEKEGEGLTDRDGLMRKIYFSAMIARAEICEINKDYKQAIFEYEQLIKEAKGSDLKEYGLDELDVKIKIADLYLRMGMADEYSKMVQGIYSGYLKNSKAQRAAFEGECIEMLMGKIDVNEFSSGGFAGPSMLIKYSKDSNDREVIVEAKNKLEKYFKSEAGCFDELLINYHYAWVLDACGEKEKAMEAFAAILNCSGVLLDRRQEKYQLSCYLVDYSKLQYAVLLSEKGEYKEALNVLTSIKQNEKRTHIEEMSKSLRESIDILKREVSINEREK